MPLGVFAVWTAYAAELNEYARPMPGCAVGDRPAVHPAGDRPGDDFNARADWEAILTRRGWRPLRYSGRVIYWTRPGKADGVSATAGFCRGQEAGDLLYVFSTAAAPFRADTAYSKFAAYALLDHAGDFRRASRALAKAGYGTASGPAPARKGVWL